MKPLFNPEHFAFTNHFNQSMLKKRIQMMNKRKSAWYAIGKYGLFISAIWVCAAFTQPYQEQVKVMLLKKVPVLKEVHKTPSLALLKDFVWKTPQEASLQDSSLATETTPNETPVPKISSTKYVVYKGDYLHLLITAKTPFEELVKIRQELDQHGLGIDIITWQMDSSGRYIRKAEMLVKSFSSMPRLIQRGKDTDSSPIEPIAVMLLFQKSPQTISLEQSRKTSLTIPLLEGTTPQEQSLKHLAQLDNWLAHFDGRWSQASYEIINRYRQLGIYNVPTSMFLAKSLTKETTPHFHQAFAIMTNSQRQDVIKVNESLHKAKFRLNDNPALLSDIESIPIQKFKHAIKYEVEDKKANLHEINILVYTIKDN